MHMRAHTSNPFAWNEVMMPARLGIGLGKLDPLLAFAFHPVDNADMLAVSTDDLHVLFDMSRARHGRLHQPPMRSKKPARGREVPAVRRRPAAGTGKLLTVLRLWCS